MANKKDIAFLHVESLAICCHRPAALGDDHDCRTLDGRNGLFNVSGLRFILNVVLGYLSLALL